MPELPDVEIFRRHAAATSLHKEIVHVAVSEERLLPDTNPQGLGRRLNGRQFQHTLRHGKYLLLDTGDGCLVFHFGMTGSLQFVGNGATVPQRSRAEFHFQHAGCLAYLSRRLLGAILFVHDRDEWIRSQQLGPDAMELIDPSIALCTQPC